MSQSIWSAIRRLVGVENPKKHREIDEFAYRRGYEDGELGRCINPYTKGSILYSSWEKGNKSHRDYELSLW